MNLLRPRFLIPLVICVLHPSSAFAGPFLDAETAYTRGDYETAYRQFKPLAEHGYGGAQYMLGVIYANGKGVTQDYSEAAKWYRKAAGQGVAHAQYDLGNMYYHGQGVPQDYVLAYMWWDVAASRYSDKEHQDQMEESIRKRNLVASKMTQAQINRAHRLARNWIEKNSSVAIFNQSLKSLLNKFLPQNSPHLFIFLIFLFFFVIFIVLDAVFSSLQFRCPYCNKLPLRNRVSRYGGACHSCGRALPDNWWNRREELRNKPWPPPN